MAALAHDWPGNVRELRNRVERAVALASGAWITAGDLFPEQAVPVADARPDSLAAARDAAERRQIVAALEQTGGQIKKAAELLGISRTTLWERMRRLDLGGGGRT
jgi:DNA-binding NtrC family response regulator